MQTRPQRPHAPLPTSAGPHALLHTSAGVPLIESLEDRRMLSAAPTTATTIRVTSASIAFGESVTVSAAVKGSKHSGRLVGRVEFLANGVPITAAGVALTVPLHGGKANYRFGPGDVALFAGAQQISAEFISSNKLPGSTSAAVAITSSPPTLTVTSDGLGYETLGKGKGKPIKDGQKARVIYTGFLASDGSIFDYATANHGRGVPPNLTFRLGAGQVVPGFDEGVLGMEVGQTRVLDIPPALAYGSAGSGSIPANAELVFLVTLQKITA